MVPRKRRTLATLGTLSAAALAGRTAIGQPAWPSRPVAIVVPFAPGGSNDVIARRLAVTLTKTLGQSVVVDNRPGGGSSIGAAHVANSPPDGHTLLFVSGSIATTAAVQKVPYDPVRAFDPISRVAAAPFVILTREGFGAKTVRELVEQARANPTRITYGSAGLGDSTQLATELFANTTGVKFTPTLAFIPDAIPDTARHVEDLLRQAAEADAAVHQQAATATFAGDADPYRHPADEPEADAADGA